MATALSLQVSSGESNKLCALCPLRIAQKSARTVFTYPSYYILQAFLAEVWARKAVEVPMISIHMEIPTQTLRKEEEFDMNIVN